MQNKNLIRFIAISIISLLVILGLSLTVIQAEEEVVQQTQFVEGRHFHRVEPAVATEVADGKIEVVELFWYGCPHCYQFEAPLNEWKKELPEYISFIRIPAVMNPSWGSHARAYYALETMGKLDEMHGIFFEAIHEQGRRLRDIDSMVRFLSQHGVDEAEFKKAYDSLYVETKLKRSDQLVRQYGATSVPSVIINGRFRTDARSAGGHEQVLAVIDSLARQEHSASE